MATRSDVLRLRIDVDNKKAIRETKQFENKVQNSNRAVKRSNLDTAASFRAIGAAVAGLMIVAIPYILAVKSLIRFGIKAAGVAGEQETAERKLAQTLRSTGGAAGFTVAQLKKQAAALQDISGISDEVTLGMQAILATFTNIKGDQFEETSLAIMNMSDLLGTTLKESAIQVGKAINDPILGMTALRRVGVSFTASQVEMVKQLVETGDVMGAQKIILKELNKEFGGQAAAGLTTYAGRLREVGGRFGDLQEAIGGPLSEVFKTFLGTVLSPTLKEMTGLVKGTDDYRTAILNLGISVAELGMRLEQLPLAKLATTIARLAEGEIAKHLIAANIVLEAMGVTADATTGKFFDMKVALEALLENGALEDLGDDAKGLKEQVTSTTGEVVTLAEAVSRLATDGGDVLRVQMMGAVGEVDDTFERLGATMSRSLRTVGIQSAQQLGDTLVDAAFDGELAFGKMLKAFLKDIAKAIIQALILKAIISALNASGPAGMAASFGVGLGSALSGGGNAKGGIAGARNGMMVSGGIPGRDSVPIMAQQGEAILPVKLTNMLMGAARNSQQQVDGSDLGPASVGSSPDAALAAPTNHFHIHAAPGSLIDERSVRRFFEDNPDAFRAGYTNMIRVGG